MVMQTKPIVLSNNRLCPYCGTNLHILDEKEINVEHVIGRRFLPKGFLDGEWNLIVKACKKCNDEKARLEGGISVISLIDPIPAKSESAEIKNELERKLGKEDAITGRHRGGANHPETNKPIALSGIKEKIEFSLPNLKACFGLSGPPQAMNSELLLSTYHIQGFYYLIANLEPNDAYPTKASSDKCLFLASNLVAPLFSLKKADWGNVSAQELIFRTSSWKTCFILVTGKGFFKCIMRKDPSKTKSPVFWALEWNNNLRVIGMIREPGQPDMVEQNLPTPNFINIDSFTRICEEIPINEHEDRLFLS